MSLPAPQLDEAATLRAEIEQYHGWIAEEIEGGAAYRLGKALVEERERRTALEGEVASLHARLASMSDVLQALVARARREPPLVTQARAADGALSALERLRQLTEPASHAAADAQRDAPPGT